MKSKPSLTCILKLIIVQRFEKALKNQNITYNELIVKPTALNTILWNANVAVKDGYLLANYSFLDSQPISFTFFPKNKTLENRVSQTNDFKKLQLISEGWFTITEENKELYFNDLRFGLLNDDAQHPQFAFSYRFVSGTNGALFAQEVPKAKRDGQALLQKIFVRIKGN